MTVKELAKTVHHDIDLYVRFNGDEIIYSAPIADILDDLVIERVQIESETELAAIIKMQPVKQRGEDRL